MAEDFRRGAIYEGSECGSGNSLQASAAENLQRRVSGSDAGIANRRWGLISPRHEGAVLSPDVLYRAVVARGDGRTKLCA